MLYGIIIITVIILYGGSTYYLDKRYKVSAANQVEHFSLKRTRNQIFAGIYLVTALAIGWLFPRYGYGIIDAIKAMYLIAFSVVLAYIDKKERIIPNRMLIALLWSAFIFLLVKIALNPSGWITLVGSSVIGCLVGGGIFLLSHMISRSGIGAGDVKLFAVLGLYVGNYAVIGIMLMSLLLTAIVGAFNVVRKKIELKQAVPFAPYVAVGVILAMLLGF